MADPTAERYRREAGLILRQVTEITDLAEQAALLQMACQYIKLAEKREARANTEGLPQIPN